MFLLLMELLEIEKEKNKIIKVQITLDNKCEFFDKVFQISNISLTIKLKAIHNNFRYFLIV